MAREPRTSARRVDPRDTRPMLPTANTGLFSPRIAETAPRTSWWLNLDRTAFANKVRQESERFRRSPFGTPSTHSSR